MWPIIHGLLLQTGIAHDEGYIDSDSQAYRQSNSAVYGYCRSKEVV